MRILFSKEITDVKKHVRLLPLIKYQTKQSPAGPSCWADYGYWRKPIRQQETGWFAKLNYEVCLWDGRQGKDACYLAWHLKLDSQGPQDGGREPTSTNWPLTSASSPWCMSIYAINKSRGWQSQRNLYMGKVVDLGTHRTIRMMLRWFYQSFRRREERRQNMKNGWLICSQSTQGV